MRPTLLALSMLAALAAGCRAQQPPPARRGAASGANTRPAAPAEPAGACGAPQPSGCGDAPATPTHAPSRTDAKGQIGAPLTVSEITPVAALLDKPKQFEGKTVRVQGVVIAHCHHRRAWFALRSGSGKASLRVMTAPAFRVPDGIQHGKTRAEAQGVVKLRTVSEAHARHLAKEHGLFGGDPGKVQGPQYIVTLHATGARFY